MVQKKKNSSPVVLRLAAVLMILVLMTTGIVSGRYARYVTTASNSDSARVAAFVFEVMEQGGQDWQLNLDSLQKPGDQQSFSFAVTNTLGEGKVSEVSIGYTVSVKAEGSIPVTITVKEAEEQKLTLDCTGNVSSSFHGVAFEAADAKTHNYILTVEWPEEKNGIEYAEGKRVLVLTVSVKGEQVD